MEGINIITDDKGNNKALILDLTLFKKNAIDAAAVLEGLRDLQKWIDETPANPTGKANSWDAAKAKLDQFKEGE